MLAIAAARYIAERRLFRDGVHFVSLSASSLTAAAMSGADVLCRGVVECLERSLLVADNTTSSGEGGAGSGSRSRSGGSTRGADVDAHAAQGGGTMSGAATSGSRMTPRRDLEQQVRDILSFLSIYRYTSFMVNVYLTLLLSFFYSMNLISGFAGLVLLLERRSRSTAIG